MTNHSKTDFSNELSDAQVSAMLMNDLAMIADDGFVDAVAQRIHRRVRNRKLVLGLSAFVGGLLIGSERKLFAAVAAGQYKIRCQCALAP